MAITFLICLFLAWPTSGLSMVVYCFIYFGRAYLRGKAAKTRDAYLTAQANADAAVQQNTHQLPTWINDPALQKQLVAETKKAAAETGMPAALADGWFSDHQTARAILTATAQFEKEGFNRFEQIVCAADFTKRLAQKHLNAISRSSCREKEPHNQDPAYEEGKRLFELGMQCASRYRCTEAIEYYTRSIATHPNPAPYINRANLLGKRIRHFEALQDLLAAQVLDRTQGNEFDHEISRELAIAQGLTLGYRNGLREELLENFSSIDDVGAIARMIFCRSFNIDPGRWKYTINDDRLVQYHLFNELDNIAKFEDAKNYPEAEELIEAYPAAFIQHKVNACPDMATYKEMEMRLHAVLCLYEEKDMRRLRRHIIHDVHSRMLARDFGDMYMSLSSNCEGITKEAMEFIEHRQKASA